MALWNECRAGPNSAYAGYVSLLLRRSDPEATPATGDVPLTTAPHCLRQWTESQKAQLRASSAATALLEAEQQQDASWRRKYDSLDPTVTVNLSWPQFEWALEAVHSRAFCGVQTRPGPWNTVPLLAPVAAALVGSAYATTSPFASESVLLALAVAAVVPTLISLTQSDEASSAVLLPMIDSANHGDTADDSSIVYNPLGRCFEWTIGPSCLVAEPHDHSIQLYIKYGRSKKSDAEWLLNYGFLPGVDVAPDPDTYRRSLARAFVERNP